MTTIIHEIIVLEVIAENCIVWRMARNSSCLCLHLPRDRAFSAIPKIVRGDAQKLTDTLDHKQSLTFKLLYLCIDLGFRIS